MGGGMSNELLTHDELLERADKTGGLRCPSCHKHVQVYTRQIYSGMARLLILIYVEAVKTNNDWVNIGHFMARMFPAEKRNSDYGKLVWWGLLKKAPGKSKDGNSNGLFRMTRKGSNFVKGNITVPKYAVEYMSNVSHFKGGQITIFDALGEAFNYDELMRRK